MENNTNTHAGQLHDLIQILTERLQIYSAAISCADADKDISLIAFLEKCMQLTQQFKSELNGILAKEDSPFAKQQWVSGSLYARWREERSSLKPIGRHQVMEVCEKMESVLLHIFQNILAAPSSFTQSTTEMLKSQAMLQQEIFEQIKDAKNRS
ncbi:hypothetical protein [Sphingobacterium arenae]|uniref:DUF2383 domain-containing protein n=1 Tax=Sphingobacterium arenae TaxID=1280598 RepID=A0ABR7Y1Z9_9SPHI|nr:hypothetical protein [Sphingobacterium arenae]MBD1425330.1 hypothetical protein [Sphingobacterium arenae]